MEKRKKVHFIGIGGIGVSALAQYYLAQGAEVSGSDLAFSEITDYLKKKGIKISKSKIQNPNVKSSPKSKLPNLVIYSPAVEQSNPEWRYFRKNRVECLSYPQALGELTKKYFTIAVSGTHGKSTTTAMISLILAKAGLDPIVIIGTKLKEFGNHAQSAVEGNNFRAGKGKYLVIEADEWQASFLNYWPKIIVLTNIEEEHLDYYRDLNHILRTFKKYILHLPKEGFLVANGDDVNIQKLISNFPGLPQADSPKGCFPISNKFSIKQFSMKQKEASELRKILKIPGEHNVSNALAALAAARILGISDGISFKALSEYKGAWRRFEEKDLKIKNLKLKIISDYGHHPTEIKATLRAAREKYPNKKIWCVFQPHQYQRTFYLFDYFVKVFSEALQPVQGKLPIDKIIITDIYTVSGREKSAIKKQVTSQKLVKAVNKEKVIFLTKEKIKNYLSKNIKGGEIVIIMGAGDIYDLNREIGKK